MRYLLGGGIGSGKSAAAAVFARLGAHVIHGDKVARGVLRSGTAETAEVLATWPQAAVGDGTIDRRVLARIVFADPLELRRLEEITLPRTRAEILAEVEQYPDRFVLVETPLIDRFVGEGWPWIIVDAPDETRFVRAVSRGPMAADEVRAVMDRQASRGEWLVVADWVIDNRGDLEQLEDQCRRVWERIAKSE